MQINHSSRLMCSDQRLLILERYQNFKYNAEVTHSTQQAKTHTRHAYDGKQNSQVINKRYNDRL